MVAILREAGLSALVESRAVVEVLGEGFQFTEGPLWFVDGSILVQDLKAEKTYRLERGRPAAVLRENNRGANGQTFGADGRVVFCEQNGRRVSVMNADGSGVETLVESWSGKRLNSPNDVVARSDGLIYFTDPPYGVAAEDRALHFQGVYAFDYGKSGDLRLLADDFEKPNGLAFSADEKTLYVCDTARYHVRAFDVERAGSFKAGSSRVFARLDPGVAGGPDGIKVDRAGRVYVAVALGIWVFEATGELLGILALPNRPANLTWCDPDASRLAITAVDGVYSIRLKVEGILPIFTGR